MKKANKRKGTALTVFFSVLSLIYIAPIFIIVMNSFKRKAYINRVPFEMPTEKTFAGLQNYVEGITKTNFWESLATSLFVTVASVAVHLHGGMVYKPQKKQVFKNVLLPVRVFNGRSFSDGHVYAVKNSGYASSGHTLGTYHSLSWLRRRTSRFYVYRLHAFCAN